MLSEVFDKLQVLQEILSQKCDIENEVSEIPKLINTKLELFPPNAKPLFKTVDEFIKSDDAITTNIKKDGIIIYDSLDSEHLWRIMTKYWSITN